MASGFSRKIAVLACLFVLLAAPAPAQVDGSASILFDVLPDTSAAPRRQSAGELRTRLFVERRQEAGEHIRFHLSGYVDALLARRVGEASRDAIVRPGDLYVEFSGERFDLRAGMSRLVWGRLDELQPTDVVNPIDLSRFLLEGRSEARLPVAMIRARAFLGGATVETVFAPVFRAGRFDQLDEPTSPFNLAAPAPLPTRREEPDLAWRNVQGGARLTSTARRVDFGLTAYRGIRTFPVLTLAAPPAEIVETFPRFTMIGGDFETVRGPWGVRGEIAAFVDDELQSTRLARGIAGRSIEAGVGVDRRTGSYRIAGNVLWARRDVDESDPAAVLLADDDEVQRNDVSFVMAVDRSFARETRAVRVFGVYDPGEATVFGRVIVSASLRDNVTLEGSGGVFAGSSLDTIGRLTHRDFLYGRLKVFF